MFADTTDGSRTTCIRSNKNEFVGMCLVFQCDCLMKMGCSMGTVLIFCHLEFQQQNYVHINIGLITYKLLRDHQCLIQMQINNQKYN